jgi:hypothetical protein
LHTFIANFNGMQTFQVSWVHVTAHAQARRAEWQSDYGLCNGEDEHPVALCRSGFWYTLTAYLQLLLLFTTNIEIHYMVRSNWPSEGLQFGL